KQSTVFIFSSTKRIFQRTAVNTRSKGACQAVNSANMGVKIGLADSNIRNYNHRLYGIQRVL
ncbi:MAG: hypothetical protein IKD25_06700, partial [Bacteroidaceae bacterium]|nr:hypothetical protein [Bacteroidaceae bacterium]